MAEEYMQEGFVTPFGKVLGVFQGVEGKSNGSDTHFSGQQNFADGTYTGYKYQCVEYARRWLLSKGLEFHSVPLAAHIWNIRFLERVSDGKATSIRPVANGSPTPPIPESIIIWKVATDVPFGHIAIITEVNLEQSYVRIAEQNVDNDIWPGNYSREFKLEVENGKYWIRDEDEMYGWMIVNFDVDGQDPSELPNIDHPVLRHIVKNPGKFEPKNEIEAKFDEVWGDAYLSVESTSYYTIESHLAYKIQYASMESLFMSMRATRHLIENVELREKTGFPEWSWDYIQKSIDNFWNGDGKALTGRAEFVFNGRHIKLKKICPDSLEGFAESCYFQDVLGERLGVTIGKSPQSFLYEQLLEQIKESVKTNIHILVGGVHKYEAYLAPFLQKALSDAGISSKVINHSQFTKTPEGTFVDPDNEVIKSVWKTTPWLDLLSQSQNSPSEHPLLDLLLSDQIITFEPIWKSVASSPAILPIVYSLMPNHVYLLAADWTVSSLLENKSVEEVRYTAGGREFSYFSEKFERQSLEGHTPVIESWFLGRKLTGFGLFEEGIERLPVYCTRIINEN